MLLARSPRWAVALAFALALPASLLARGVPAVAREARAAEVLGRFAAAAGPAVASVRATLPDGSEKQASGLVVSPRGHVVTTLHVVEGCASLAVRTLPWTTARPAAVLFQEPETHLALLRLTEDPGLPQPFLGLLRSRPPAPGTPCVLVSGPEPDAGQHVLRYRLGAPVDPWAAAALPGAERFSFLAPSLDRPFPVVATGAPVFDGDGRVLGLASFFHNLAAPDGLVRFVWHVAPAAVVRDLLAVASHPDVVALHGDQGAAVLAELVSRAEEDAPLAERVQARRRRTALVQSVRGWVASREPQERAEAERVVARAHRDLADLPLHVRTLAREHPDWPLPTLRAIADGSPRPGMTGEQVLALQGPPRRIVRGGELTADGRRLDVWEYERPFLLGFDASNVLVSIR